MYIRKPWTLAEYAYLKQHYPTSRPVSDIAQELNRSEDQVSFRARKLGLVRPRHCSELAVRNFEAKRGKSLEKIAAEYQYNLLARADLAGDIGISTKTLKAFLSPTTWQGWPVMTESRWQVCEQRRA